MAWTRPLFSGPPRGRRIAPGDAATRPPRSPGDTLYAVYNYTRVYWEIVRLVGNQLLLFATICTAVKAAYQSIANSTRTPILEG